MTARRAAAALLALLVLAELGACASGTPASPDEIARRSEPVGIAADLVYTADVDGFSLAVGSVGPYADEGMSAIWTRPADDGLQVVTLLTTRAAEPGLAPCAELADVAGATELRCTVAMADDAHVTLAGEGVDGGTLRAVAETVRVPSPSDLGRLFADVRMPEGPVERGDLPPGDGAPDNSVGVGG